MQHIHPSILAAAALAPAFAVPVLAQPLRPHSPDPFDVVIANGRVVDGTGSSWYAADVGIRGGRIAAIGRLDGATAHRRVDARGLVVAPGFIDMLGQSELSILVDPRLPSKIFQGITTEITGEGGSVAPLDDVLAEKDRVYFESLGITADWRTFDEYFARLERQGIGVNFATFVGATQVRRMVLATTTARRTRHSSKR